MRNLASPVTHRSAILILALLLVPIVVACQARPAWRGSVKIGLVVPFYGYDSSSANAAYFATKLAIRERNESGGISGSWIELVALDDQNDPEVAALQARELAVDPDVLGVIGHLNSDTALDAAPVYREAGLASITLGGSAIDLASTYPELLRMSPDDAAVASHALQVITERTKVQRIALIHDSSTGHSSAASAFLAEANRRKLEVGAVASIKRDQREFESVLKPLVSNPPDLVIFVGNQFQAASFASQARHDLRNARILIAGCANSPDFVRIATEDAVGVLHVPGAMAAGDAASNQFAARYRSAFGIDPTTYAFAAYEAAGLLFTAVESAAREGGGVDRPAVGRQMRRDGRVAGAVRASTSVYEVDESGYPGKLWR